MRQPGRGPGRSRLAGLILIPLFLIFACWSIATPLFGSPDEPSHVVHAAAVVRGEWTGRPIQEPQGVGRVVSLPAVFSRSDAIAACIAFQPTANAACGPGWHTDTQGEQADAVTFAGAYNPVYYLLVGWPSRLTSNRFGVYGMRLASALLCALLIAGAVGVTRSVRYGRLLRLGLLTGVTPMTLFLGGVVNPNGAEICAAAAVWCGMIVLLTSDRPGRDGRTIAFTGAATALLVNLRSLSPLWVVLILLTTITAVGSRGRLATLLRRRDLQLWLAVDAAATAFAVGWTIVVQPLAHIDEHMPISPGSAVDISLGRTSDQLRGMVGFFGWIDTPSPLLTYLIWAFAIGAIVTAAVSLGRSRPAVALIGLCVFTALVPVIFEAPQASAIGFVWQGRYTLPIAIGIPLIGAATFSQRRSSSRPPRIDFALPTVRTSTIARPPIHLPVRLFVFLGVMLGLGHVLALGETIRRYRVGLGEGFNLSWVLHGAWGPPLPGLLLMITAVAAFGLLMAAAWSGERDPHEPGRRPVAAI